MVKKSLFVMLFWITAQTAGAIEPIKIQASDCQDVTLKTETSYATPIRIGSQFFLIGKAFDIPESDAKKICFQVVEPVASKEAIQLIKQDQWQGLAIYNLPQSLQKEALTIEMSKLRVQHFRAYPIGFYGKGWMQILTVNSQRHFLPEDENLVMESTWGGGDRDFLHTAGAPLVLEQGLRGLLTDQTIVTLPAQQARVFRERDLGLLSEKPFTFFRVTLQPRTVALWMQKVLSPDWRPSLVLKKNLSVDSKTSVLQWTVDQAEMTETCYPEKAIPKTENIPIGGARPFGTGGLEEILSTCRMIQNQGETSSKLLLAYQKKDGNFTIQSIFNVHHFMQLKHRKVWSFAFENDRSTETELSSLREAADRAHKATIHFFQNLGGNHLVLRKAFLLTHLLQSKSWQVVETADLDQMLLEIDQDLPLYLGDVDGRTALEKTEFSKAKKSLLADFENLKKVRGSVP